MDTVDTVDADRMVDAAWEAGERIRHSAAAKRGGTHDDEDAHVRIRRVEML